MIEVIETISFVLMGMALLLAALRVVIDGSLADKMLGADMVTVILASTVALAAGYLGTAIYLDLVVVIALLGFLSTITVARYIEVRGARYGEEVED